MQSAAGRADAARPALPSGVVRARQPKSGVQIMACRLSTCLVNSFSGGDIHYPGIQIMKSAAASAPRENEAKFNSLICIGFF
jgi:hypothetical protein